MSTDYTNPESIRPSEPTPGESVVTPLGPIASKVLTTAIFGASSSIVLAVGVVSAVVFKRTTVLTFQNIAHTLLTKGRVWLPSKYRDFSSPVE
jgi:hypothetical protein